MMKHTFEIKNHCGTYYVYMDSDLCGPFESRAAAELWVSWQSGEIDYTVYYQRLNNA